MYIYIYMWGRPLLVTSLSAESKEMVEGGNIKQIGFAGIGALMCWALMDKALMGCALMG